MVSRLSTITILLLLSVSAIHAWRGAFVVKEQQKEEEYVITKGLRKVQKVDENVYVQPGIPFLVGPIWYKYDDKSWFWTPFGPNVVVSPRWIPVSVTKVPNDITGKGLGVFMFRGAKPAHFNWKIIRYLEKHAPDPATEFQLVERKTEI